MEQLLAVLGIGSTPTPLRDNMSKASISYTEVRRPILATAKKRGPKFCSGFSPNFWFTGFSLATPF
jgi:hypothetical protein